MRAERQMICPSLLTPIIYMWNGRKIMIKLQPGEKKRIVKSLICNITKFLKAGIMEIFCPPNGIKYLLYHSSCLWEVLTYLFSSLTLWTLIFMSIMSTLESTLFLDISQCWYPSLWWYRWCWNCFIFQIFPGYLSQVFAFYGNIFSAKTEMER